MCPGCHRFVLSTSLLDLFRPSGSRAQRRVASTSDRDTGEKRTATEDSPKPGPAVHILSRAQTWRQRRMRKRGRHSLGLAESEMGLRYAAVQGLYIPRSFSACPSVTVRKRFLVRKALQNSTVREITLHRMMIVIGYCVDYKYQVLALYSSVAKDSPRKCNSKICAR